MFHGRGATSESIDALPTYKFKTKRRKNRGDREINLESQCDGGILAAGTDKERMISGEDAVSILFTCVIAHLLDASAKKLVAPTRKISSLPVIAWLLITKDYHLSPRLGLAISLCYCCCIAYWGSWVQIV